MARKKRDMDLFTRQDDDLRFQKRLIPMYTVDLPRTLINISIFHLSSAKNHNEIPNIGKDIAPYAAGV